MLEKTPDGLEPARQALLAAVLSLAPFDGWTDAVVQAAAHAARIDRPTLTAAFPRGLADVLTYWSDENDEAMRVAMAAPSFARKRVREKVADALWSRLEALRPHKEAARRAAATLALPFFAPLATKMVWKTADVLWRELDDRSTDFNFYSKRGILCGVWMSSLARWLADDGPNEESTRAFLDARIENVMQFEKLKTRMRDAGFDPEGMFGWLAKKRYPREAGPSPHEDAKVDETLKETFPASDAPYWTGGVRD